MEKTKLKSKAGKPVYKTDEGELVSEKTIGVEMDGKEYTIPTVHKGKILEDEEAIDLFRKGKIKPVAVSDSPEEGDKKAEQRSKGLLDMNVGGTPKKNLESQQLEMFGDIGMAKSSAKKDPVSGNEIPKASTAEEVRDDIPARLSEGEFVLPADVVRYHGLEKLMNLRQEAKQGINTMDKMGQLGNADEATMPDDLPFDINDIEMSEGGFISIAGQSMPSPRIAGEQIQMQTGGLANTGTYQVPTNIASTPSYFQSYKQTTAPFTPFVPPKQTTIPPIVPVTSSGTTGPSFQTLIPTQGQRPVTKEYRNEAGQKLFIPFVNDKPIYPIPEGYTEYVEEKAKTEEPKVTGKQAQSTRVIGDEGSQDTGIDTTVLGKTGESLRETLNKRDAQGNPIFSENKRANLVMNAVDQARGMGTTGKNLAAVALGMVNPLGLGTLAGAYDLGSRAMGGRGLGIGEPDTTNYQNILDSFGQGTDIGLGGYEGMTSEEIDQDEYPAFDALSRAIYGVDYNTATQNLGVQPTFRRGFKPGDIDPRTGGTYDKYGQSTDDDGGVSYSSFSAAGKGFAAMSASGFMGGVKDAQRVASSKTASAKNKARAQAYLDYLNKEDKDDDKKPDDKKPDNRFLSPSDVGDKPSKQTQPDPIDSGPVQTQPDPIDYSPPSTVGDPSYSTPSNVASASSFGDEPGDDTDSSPSGDPGGGFGGSSEGDFGFTATGGLMNKKKIIMKKKPKVKKMKRGGLASR